MRTRHTMRRTPAAILAALIVASGLVFGAAPAQAAPVTVTDPISGASITLSSGTIAPGQRVEISGRGFVPVQGSTGEPLVAVRPYDFDAGPAWTIGGRDAYRPANTSQPPGSEAKYWFVTHHDAGGSFEGWIQAPATLTEVGPLGNGQHWLRILSGAFFTTTGDRLTDPITFQVRFTAGAGSATIATGLTSPTGVFQAGTRFRPGAQLTVRGSGFTPEATVTAGLDGGPLGTLTAEPDGSLPATARLTLPAGVAVGSRTLRLTDGEHTASAALQVTAAPTARVLTARVRPGGTIAYDLTGYVGVGGAGQKVAVVVDEQVLACAQAGGTGAAAGVATLPAAASGSVVVGFNAGLSCVPPPTGVINDQPISRLTSSIAVDGAAPVVSAAPADGGRVTVTGEGFTARAGVTVTIGDTRAGILTADASGRVSGQVPASGVGTHRVLADDGSRVAATSVRIVQPQTARVALSAPAPLSYGAARTTRVTLTVAGRAAAGTVVVNQGTWSRTVRVSAAGTAVALPRDAAAGKHTLTARFAGDQTTAGATASRTFTVTRAKSSASLKLSASSVKRGKRVTATVRLTVPGAAQVRPTGTVRIYAGSKRLGSYTVKASHRGVLTVKLPAITKKGSHKIKAVYAGTKNLVGKTTKTVRLRVR